jgi:hypothetical protein
LGFSRRVWTKLNKFPVIHGGNLPKWNRVDEILRVITYVSYMRKYARCLYISFFPSFPVKPNTK